MIDADEGNLPWQRNKTNRLFVKDEVGRTKHSTFNLPPIDHVYGKAPKKDAENAKQGILLFIFFLLFCNVLLNIFLSKLR